MGEGRSIRALWNQYQYLRTSSETQAESSETSPIKSESSLFTYCKRYSWVDRSKAWDRELWIQEEKDHLRFWKQYRLRLQKVGDKMLEHAEEMLKFPLVKSRSVGDDGRNVLIEPAEWKLRDATSFTAESLKLVQAAVGPATLQGLEEKQAKALDLHVEEKQMKELEAIAVLAQSGMASEGQLEILTNGISEIQAKLREYNSDIVQAETEAINAVSSSD